MLIAIGFTCKVDSFSYTAQNKLRKKPEQRYKSKAIDSLLYDAYNEPFENCGGTSMKLDQNKKILMGVVLILYILYKMMGG